MSVSQENRGSLFPGNAWGVPIHCQLIIVKKLSVMPIVAEQLDERSTLKS